MSRDSAKAHYTKQPGDPDEGFITASDAQAAIDDIYDDMSAPAVIADGSVTSGKIAADAVGSAQIATGAVGSGELATDAVTSDKIADGAVSNAHVASDAAIAASKVAGTAVTQADTGTVTNGMLAGSIAKTKVAGTAITAADTGTVTGTMIGTGEVGNGNLAANAVNEAKIASGAVTTVKIEDDAVTTAKIAADAVTSAEIAANAVGASELADNAVDTAAIAADAVTADKIANDTITAAELAAGSVGTSELADDSVTAAKILDGTITANEIQNASITGAKLVNDTITATQIAANAVGSSELADNAVDTAAIQAQAVTAAKIADDTITATQIAANAVGASELADNAVDTAAIQDGAVTPVKMQRQVGNLLTENQASVETDASGWVNGGGSPTIARSTAKAADGSASLLVTATGTGGLMAVTSSRVPVTAGQTYTMAGSLASGTGSRTYRVGVLFYDAASGGTLIGDGYSPYVAPGASFAPSSVTLTVPAGATHALPLIDTGSTGSIGDSVHADALGLWRGAGGQWALPGTPILGLTDAPLGNLLTLNQATGTDAEAATTGFIAYQSTLASSTAQAKSGSRSLAVTATGTGAAYAYTARLPITAGQVHTASVAMRSNQASGETGAGFIEWYADASGGSVLSTVSAATLALTNTGWTVLSVTGQAPSNANYAVINWKRDAGATGAVTYMDEFSLHRGAAGQWQLPGVPVPGQSRIAVNGAVDLSGTGSPEGVVTAAPGSTWQQNDATTDVKGWIRWIKATGTGNTGWQVDADADTGWRDVTAGLLNSWSAVTAPLIRRIGNQVELNIRFRLDSSGASADKFYTLPSGFRPNSAGESVLGFFNVGQVTGTTSPKVVYYTLSDFTVGSTARDIRTSGYFVWTTNDAWPSSLPGSPA